MKIRKSILAGDSIQKMLSLDSAQLMVSLPNAMTSFTMTIVSLFHMTQILLWNYLLSCISEKQSWSIQSLWKWSIKMFIANFFIVIISQIIFKFFRISLGNDPLFMIKTYQDIFSLAWQSQDSVVWDNIWQFLVKPEIPHMTITFIILIMYMQLNTIKRHRTRKKAIANTG